MAAENTTRITPFGQSPEIFEDKSKPGRVLREIADAHGATSRQVALRFLLRLPEVFVIPKASDIAHVAAFPRGKAPRGLPMI